MASGVPLVVLAAPGAGGAQLAAALAAAADRPVAAWDEVDDDPIGDGEVVRTTCRDVLWRRERDWTCPPPRFEVDDADRAAAERLRTMCADAPVLYDVALPFLLPLLLDLQPELEVVVAVRDAREALPALLAGQPLEPGAADDLLRAAHAQLAAVAAHADATVVELAADLDLGPLAAGVMGTTAAPDVVLPAVAAEPGVEDDAAVVALQARAAASGRPSRLTRSGVAVLDGDTELDRFVGPRAAARRALLLDMAAADGSWGEVLECTRARGPGAWLAQADRAEVALVDGLAGMRRAVTRAPASVATVLLADVLSWCDRDELRAVLELAMEVVAYGGTIVVGHSSADDDTQRLAGRVTVRDDDVVALGRELGLVAMPTRTDGGVTALPFTAQTAVAGTIRDLEARVERLEVKLERRTQQRDAALARHDALRGRRGVRFVLAVADVLGRALERLRGGPRG